MADTGFTRKRILDTFLEGGPAATPRIFTTGGQETDVWGPYSLRVVRFYNSKGEQVHIQRLYFNNLSAGSGPFLLTLNREPSGTLSWPSNCDLFIDSSLRSIQFTGDIESVFVYNHYANTRTMATTAYATNGLIISGFTFPNP